MYQPILKINLGKKNYKIFGFVFLLIGLILLLGTLVSFFSIREKYSYYIRVEGKVISNIKCDSKKYQNYFKPLVLFATKDGKTIKFSPSVCSSPSGFNDNDIVKVLYPDNNPSQAVLARNDFQYFSVFMWGSFCFCFLFLGVMIFVLGGGGRIVGPAAGVFVGVYYIVGGLFFIFFLGSKHWFNDSRVVNFGVAMIVFGGLVMAWEVFRKK